MKSKKKLVRLFVFLFAFTAVMACILMPQEKTLAYRGNGSANQYQAFKAGEFHIQKIREKESANDPDEELDAVFNVKIEPWDKDSVDADYSEERTITAGYAAVDCPYLDAEGLNYFFSYPNENRARITITETDAPAGFEKLSYPIVVEYRYENRDPEGQTICPVDGEGPSESIWYQLNVEIVSDPEGVASIDLEPLPEYYSPFNYILKIQNKPEGKLTIRKELDGNDTDSEKEFEFTAEFKDQNGDPLADKKFGQYTTDGAGEIVFNLKGGEEYTFAGLAPGTQYRVWEKDYTAKEDGGYDAVIWTNEGGLELPDDPSGTVPVPQDGDPAFFAKYTATNTKNSYGGLSVTKKTAGVNKDAVSSFEFTVTLSDTEINGTYGDMTFTDGVAAFSLGDEQTATASELPANITYTVEEEDYSADGYSVTSRNATGTIEADNEKPVIFVNTRSEGGVLTIKKELSGNASEEDREFEFSVLLKDAGGSALSGVTIGEDTTDAEGRIGFTLKGGETKTISDLPDGTQYLVEESDYTGDGYDAVVWTDSEGGVLNGNPSGSADSAADGPFTAQYTATNTRNAYGSLSVSKKTAGVDKNKVTAFDFTVTLSDTKISGLFGEMEFDGGVSEFRLGDGTSKKAENLPAGITYTVEEADYSGDGYTTEKTNDTGTIEADQTAKAVFTNTRAADSVLTIKKELAGNNTDPEDTFTFEIDLGDTSINETYGNTVFEAGKAVIALKGGEAAEIELPDGTSYTVTETDALDYESSNSGNSGTISETTPAVVVFTNTRNKEEEQEEDPTPVTVDPPIQKKVEGDTPDAPGTFTFLMKAVSTTADYAVAEMPMPAGAKDGVARHSVAGPGSYEFGEFTLTQAGQYTYEISEENTAEEGYTYDTVRYTIVWDVTEKDGALKAVKTITDDKGNTADTCLFTNTYKKDEPEEPDDPTEPDEPDEPDTPDRPSEPDKPSRPEKPQEPAVPPAPQAPADPPAQSSAEAARSTGDSSHVGAYGAILFAAAALLGIIVKRRHSKL